MSLNVFLQAVNLGLLWSVMAIGVFITFRILNFADLTVEGSFVTGAAVVASTIAMGINPIIGTLLAIIAGILAGLITGFFHTVLKIPPLLSGILTMTGLFSINLRIMALGSPQRSLANISLGRGVTTIMNQAANFFSNILTTISGWFGHTEAVTVSTRDASIVIGLVAVIFVIFILKWFFNTELGYALRATGDNEPMIKAQGVNTNKMKMLGLATGNACVALSGALVSQSQGFADVNMGVGTIVTGLAAVIIGEVFFRDKNNSRVFIAVVFGAVLFFIIRALVLAWEGMDANDFRLFTAVMIAFALSLPMFRDKFNVNFKKLFLGSKGGGN